MVLLNEYSEYSLIFLEGEDTRSILEYNLEVDPRLLEEKWCQFLMLGRWRTTDQFGLGVNPGIIFPHS